MINKVVLVGRITRDIDLRKTNSGLSVARFTVACNRVPSRSNTQQNGNNQSADFISCVAWRQSADYLASYATKGSIIGVEGHITTGSYDGADGRKVYTTEVTADRVTLIGGRNENASMNATMNNTASMNNYSVPGINPNPANAVSNEELSQYADMLNGPALDISSDDLPF